MVSGTGTKTKKIKNNYYRNKNRILKLNRIELK